MIHQSHQVQVIKQYTNLPSSPQRSKANGEAAKERCLRALQGFEASVLDIVSDTDPASVVEHAVYVRYGFDFPQSLGPVCSYIFQPQFPHSTFNSIFISQPPLRSILPT